ncbi:hypothetical protein [Embleya scabrispora]|nr:hypothetical protein [Embleya scabrispora]
MRADLAAEITGLSPAALRGMVRRGQLRRWGGTERYPLYYVGDLRAAMQQREQRKQPA